MNADTEIRTEPGKGRGPSRRRWSAVAAIFVLGVAYGYMLHRNRWPPYGIGRSLLEAWRGTEVQSAAADLDNFWVNLPEPDDGLTAEQRESIKQLRAIGYVTTVEEDGDGLVGGVVARTGEAQPGPTLYTTADAPAARLIGLDGEVLFEWSAGFAQIFPGADAAEFDAQATRYWFKANVRPNGDLLVVHEGVGIARLDRDSNVLWSLLNRAHHDVTVGPGDHVYVLTRETVVRPDIHETRPILEDFVTVLEADGAVVRRISLLDALVRSEFAGLLAAGRTLVASGEGDIFHTNDVDLLFGAPWSEGTDVPATPTHLLLSFRNLDTVAVLELESETIVWTSTGLVHRQHDPTILPGGSWLVFDNREKALGSRAVEFSTVDQSVRWVYPERGGRRLYSDCCGTAQRLPNGNTLTTFTLQGIAVEVTPSGQVVWEFQSPARHEGGKVAALMMAERLPEFATGIPFLEEVAAGTSE